MEITGSIRGSSTGIDIGIKAYDGTFHRMKVGPLYDTMADLYKFVISGNDRMNIKDRVFTIEKSNTPKGFCKRWVTVPTAFGNLSIFRFTAPGKHVPADKAGFSIDIPTVETVSMEDYNEIN